MLLMTVGTREDLERLGCVLAEGLLLHLWCDDADEDGAFNAFLYDAIAHFDHALGCWVGVIDWSTLAHEH